MNNISILEGDTAGKNFIPAEFQHGGKDEYYYRNSQTAWPKDKWRPLKKNEIELLEKNNNTSDNWGEIFVTDKFEPSLVKNNTFSGLVRIGDIKNVLLEHDGLKLPVGITNSRIISCDIGDEAAIHNASYISHFIIGSRCIIFNVKEMITHDNAKFGNGIIKDGESEKDRNWLEPVNEAGYRKILPFDGMTTADAYLWARYREDKSLQKKLIEVTQNSFDAARGYYGFIGAGSIIKNTNTLVDVKTGENCFIHGSSKLENITINSSNEEPTEIGEGVELLNGITGMGCSVQHGTKAMNFVIGHNSRLMYGVRFINSVVGDNSTISCCEVLNNLIFPAHEQHHNNSFLIASLVMGQSNIAAGATIGSNHNSRANDNEILAGRGFWPGLCSSFKHPSRFASFSLLAKADYPYELDIKLPFSLVNNNLSKDRLEVMPAYWWLYNMYALVRNSAKYKARDKRIRKTQNIEFDFLAPDTAEEIFNAMHLLEVWAGKAWMSVNVKSANLTEDNYASKGAELFNGRQEDLKDIEIIGHGIEKSNRKVIILKAYNAYHAYKDMLYYYAVKNIIYAISQNKDTKLNMVSPGGADETNWVNFGGQLIQEKDAGRLIEDINSGKLKTWNEIHNRYEALWEKYNSDKLIHACFALCRLAGVSEITNELWASALDRFISIHDYVSEQVYTSRKKDFENSFMKVSFRNEDEMEAVLGSIDDNSFINEVRQETEKYKKLAIEIKKRKIV